MLTARRGFLAVAVLAGFVLVSSAVAAPVGGLLEWVVCVSTLDHPQPRFDSYWPDDQAGARARRSAILANGWVISGDSGRFEDSYRADAIIKVRLIDLNLDGGGERGCGSAVSMDREPGGARSKTGRSRPRRTW